MSVADDIVFASPNIELRVNKNVYNCWLNHRQLERYDTEQFGILIGSRLEDESLIWINKCTTPQIKDISKRTRFVIQDPFHQKTIEKWFKDTHGELGYVGTWHTHPQNQPIPSHIDFVDWGQCIMRNPDRQLVFVIVGNRQIKIYIQINNKLQIVARRINE